LVQTVITAAHKAWSNTWLGDSHFLLADLMDRLRKKPAEAGMKPYNHSIAIIQSSGMGKSRLVDSIAERKFCFPFNIREPLGSDQYAYPPSDLEVYFYFRDPQSRRPGDEQILERMYLAFFAALFECAVPELQTLLDQHQVDADSISGTWRKHLAMGATEHIVGQNREDFYKKVKHAATQKVHSDKISLDELITMVIASGNAFTNFLRGRLQESANKSDNALATDEVLFFIYFDEAHVLTEVNRIQGQPPPRSKYHLLGRVLGRMDSLPFFTVFLSTNSWLGSFAPSTSKHPSLRDWGNVVLHAPFTELPFDTFAVNSFGVLSEKKVGVRLPDVCTVAYIVKFGRPLWYSLYESGSEKVKSEMVDFAKVKLTKGSTTKEEAVIAAISLRIILDFDISRDSARACEQRLVESHMRVVFAIPDHLEFLRSGTPSERLLAEAAAQFLNAGPKFMHEAPDILANLLNKGFLARGERGEMVGRLLWTLAHDAAIDQCGVGENSDSQLIYHRPVRLLNWLKALIAPCWHSLVLEAKPVADPNGMTLEEAFQDVYLNFSHFARADDYTVICPQLLWISLIRGFAYQCADNQKSTDLITAMHHGGLEAPICAENTSPLYGQIKNRATETDVLVNPHVGGHPINHLPTFSIVHDVGLQENRVYSHASLPAKSLRGDGRTENIHVRHYQIHIEGCSHETYAVIPNKKNEVYSLLLAATKLDHDFPRNALAANRAALIRLKPAFSAKDASSSLEWVNDAVSTFSTVEKGKGKARATALVTPSFPVGDETSDIHLNPLKDAPSLRPSQPATGMSRRSKRNSPQLASPSRIPQTVTGKREVSKQNLPQPASSSGMSRSEGQTEKEPQSKRKKL